MKISTRLRLAVFVPSIMAIVILVALVFSSLEMRKTQEAGDAVRQIRSSITELNHFIFSYTLYHEERPRQQFLAEHENLIRLIDGTQLSKLDQQRLLERIRQDSDTMKGLFSRLVSAHEQNDKGVEERLVSLLLLTSYEADTDAALLRSLVDAGIRVNGTMTIGLICLVLVLATVPLTIILIRTRRGILSSLSNLSKGVAVIGTGNLDFKIAAKGNDEISDVTRAFNLMTTELKTVTTSKAELEREIEERKKAEEALRQSEQRWATTLASIGDAVIATDAEGMLTFMNAEAEHLTGWKLDEASSKPVSDIFNIINEQTRKPVESPVPRIIRDGIVVGLANHTVLVKKNGTEIPIDDSGAPIKDENGRISGVVLIFRDVTEHRKTDRIKDEFIGMVSHELRTPLTIVTGAVHTAMMEGLPPEELPMLLKEAALGAESLAGILENLLELSRHQSNRLLLNVETTDATQVITAVVEQLRSKSPIHRLLVDVSEKLTLVHVDKVRLERILNNLIDNAIKYSPKGGEVRITACEDDGSLVVSVSDQGIGIPSEAQSQLFQPFQRLEQTPQTGIRGLGLGLTVCRRLVEAHQGRIWLESQPGKGTTFYFSIPLTVQTNPG